MLQVKQPAMTGFLMVVALAILGSQTVVAAKFPSTIDLPKPNKRQFVLDTADMLSSQDELRIQKLCDKLLTDKATPIIVVTIVSIAKHNGPNMRIETFAKLLFNQWGIGYENLHGQNWNNGILLIISKNDRKARIQLGDGWKRENDSHTQQIMDQQIIPQFKKGEFSKGIVDGVESLDKMARGLELPKAPISWWAYALVIGFVGMLIFTIVSLIRRGSNGWAWLFWAFVFGAISVLIYAAMTSSDGGEDEFEGGFGGGSFGGGFSGGGGATGSW